MFFLLISLQLEMVVPFKFPASTMVIQKESPFTKFLNHEISMLRECGIMQQIFEKHAKKKPLCQIEESPKPIQFKKVIFPFFVYIIGVISALAIFFIENIIVKRNEKVETEQVKHKMENYSKTNEDEVQYDPNFESIKALDTMRSHLQSLGENQALSWVEGLEKTFLKLSIAEKSKQPKS